MDKIPNIVEKTQQEFTHNYLPGDAGGQANRAADRFALIAAAGEMATSMGITGWQKGEAIQAAKICFKAWLEHRGGTGNQEATAMLAQVRQFFEAHGDARFTQWGSVLDDHSSKTLNRAGLRKLKDAVNENNAPIWDDTGKRLQETEYFVFPEVFKSDVCKVFNHKAVSKMLADKEFYW